LRYGWPLTLCLVDLDGFKGVNDRLGHPAGDEVLRRVAAVIDAARVTDDKFRIGGDEFAILMPKTPREDAALAATRICHAIAEVEVSDGSIGACFGLAEGLDDPAAMHAAADLELLAAKDDLYNR
jgi:diguanylate cyclase (GGDEF)-like protein